MLRIMQKLMLSEWKEDYLQILSKMQKAGLVLALCKQKKKSMVPLITIIRWTR